MIGMDVYCHFLTLKQEENCYCREVKLQRSSHSWKTVWWFSVLSWVTGIHETCLVRPTLLPPKYGLSRQVAYQKFLFIYLKMICAILTTFWFLHLFIWYIQYIFLPLKLNEWFDILKEYMIIQNILLYNIRLSRVDCTNFTDWIAKLLNWLSNCDTGMAN
jgi:hypothetical protein